MNYKRRAILMVGAVLCLNLSVYSQLISLKMNDVSVKKAMMELQTKSGFSFVYIAGDLDIRKMVTIDANQLDEAINQILKGQNVSYEIQGKNIVIKRIQELKVANEQKIKISGIVKDVNGAPVVGATVKEKGTSNGTITDIDGIFMLEVQENALLDISYIGFKSQQLKVQKGGKALSVILKEDSELLDEVVVIGYGTQRKGEVASSIATVKSENFLKVPSPDAAQMIRGQVPGLAVITPDANPLSSSQLSLRGITTLGQNTTPLILIDGIPGALNSVSPDEIAQIDVLKDGSAAAIYGTRGTNGVILITTKHVNGEMPTTVDVNAYISIQQIVKKLPMMTAGQYREKVAQGGYGGATDYGGDVDWLDEITRTPISQVYNVSLRGGSQTTNYLASLEYRSLEGIIQRSDNQIIYPRIEVTHRMFNDKLRINAGLNGSLKKYFDGADGGGYKTDVYAGAIQFNPTDPVRDENGNWKERPINDYLNPLALLWETEGENKETALRMFANLAFTPIAGLNIKYTASKNIFNQIRGYYETKQHSSTTKNGKNGYASRGTQSTYETLSELTVQYNKTLFKDHNFTLLGGYSWMKSGYEDYWMQNWDFPSDDYTYNNMSEGQALRDGKANEDSEKRENLLIAYFARLNYNYK
ncbi:SusC/RagA family TonB-linked outer membrane protein, partial [Phocaeicola sp.]